MSESASEYIARLQAMSPAQLEIEKMRQHARIDSAEMQRFGEARSAKREGRTPALDTYTRADSATSLLKAKVSADGTGRRITEFVGGKGAFLEWTAPYRTSGFLQDGILTGSEPADVEWLSQAASRKRAARDEASRGEK